MRTAVSTLERPRVSLEPMSSLPTPSAKSVLFEEQAMQYIDKLYAHAMRKTSNRVDANDLVQETYLKAFAAFDQYEQGTNLHHALALSWHQPVAPS